MRWVRGSGFFFRHWWGIAGAFVIGEFMSHPLFGPEIRRMLEDQDADGLKRPRKTTIRRDRKVLVEAEVTEFKSLDKPDPKLFEKP